MTTDKPHLPKGLYWRPNSPYIWMRFRDANGRPIRESTETISPDEAWTIRTQKLVEVRADKFLGARERKIGMTELFDDYVTKAKSEVEPSTYARYGRDLKKIRPFFDDLRIASVTRVVIEQYITHRREQYDRGDVRAFRAGGWKATLNRELTVLNRVFETAIRNGKIKPSQKPVMPERFRENPARQGHIDHEASAALIRRMPRGYALAFDFALWTGWRKSAVSNLQKTAVNPYAGTIDLPPELAKNRDIATVPLHAHAKDILAEAATLQGNAESPYVFTHEGRPLRNWGKVWSAARAAAAAELNRPDILKLVFHDTCREAARLYDNLGIRREVALVMFGRKTDSIFRRYRIVPAEDLAEATKRLNAAAAQRPPRTVLPLRRRARATGQSTLVERESST